MIVTIPYQPRALQRQIHAQMRRFSVLVCHRRFGKTVLAINHLLRAAAQCTLRAPRYAYVAPQYRQAKMVVWDYLKHYSGPIPGTSHNEAELRADLPNGARVQLYGADNPDALRGGYWDGAVCDEYAYMQPRVWTEVLRPALSDRKGFAIFIGTPQGHNGFYDLYEAARLDAQWYTALHRASETGIIDADELQSARNVMSEAEYAQEYECSFEAGIVGAYYGRELERAQHDGRICSVPVDRYVLTHTAWDLGIGDSTAIWFVQIVGKELHLIDYYESSGVGLDHYAAVLRDRGYTYGEHILPHDAQAHELGSGRTRVETLAALGLKARVIAAQSVDDGINAVRTILDRCWFDVQRCQRGLEALRQYRREWDHKGQSFRARPLHDWASHGADAFRYLAMGLRETAPRVVPAPKARERRSPVAGGWMAA